MHRDTYLMFFFPLTISYMYKDYCNVLPSDFPLCPLLLTVPCEISMFSAPFISFFVLRATKKNILVLTRIIRVAAGSSPCI